MIARRNLLRAMATAPNGRLSGWPHQNFTTEILPADASHIEVQDPSPSNWRYRITHPRTESALRHAAAELNSGELVAFPTETVYGLGAVATDERAVEKIYAAKGRPSDNPLIVHVSDLNMVRDVADDTHATPACRCLMETFWPGSLTLLFPVRHSSSSSSEKGKARLPPSVTSQLPTVGIRMPSHPLARALIALTGHPIAAPSSNASGRPSPTIAQHVYYDLGGPLDGAGGRIHYILDGGPCNVGVESTVVDASSVPSEVRILRPGGVTVEAIQRALAARELLASDADKDDGQRVRVRVYGRDLARSAQQEAHPTTPGMKYKHYSPNAKVVLVDVDAAAQTTWREALHAQLSAAAQTTHIGILAPLDSPLASAVSKGNLQLHHYSLGASADSAVALFAGLRHLDELPVSLIFVQAQPQTEMGLAFMNRVEKAATERVAVRIEEQ